MESGKIRNFMKLAGQPLKVELNPGSREERKLAARLLLSETLEYVIHGLGIFPEFSGVTITDPDAVCYLEGDRGPDALQMTDGLADVAYTMYWNALSMGVPLEEAFDLVCDNNLQKFVRLDGWAAGEGKLDVDRWHCCIGVTWPSDVVDVSVVKVSGDFYAVGKDEHGKVRKPSTYRPVDFSGIVNI